MNKAAAAQVDFTRIAEIGDTLFPIVNEMREAAPVIWNDSLNGWIVNRHADVIDGFQAKVPLSCVRMQARSFGDISPEALMAKLPLTLASIPKWIVNLDAPRHSRLRRLMSQAFGRKVVEGLRPFGQATIKQVLDSVDGRASIEFVEEVARQITGRVILRKFGLDDSVLKLLKKWSYAFNEGLGGSNPTMEGLLAVEEAIAEMRPLFLAEIAKRRETPGDDFLSELVRAHEGEDRLTEEEILGICYLVIVAGHDTTLNSMSFGVRAFIRHPEARRWMLENPDRIMDSVMEVMRFTSMSAVQARVAAEDFDWHGAPIKKGDLVWLMVAGANRDPRVFANPEALDPPRPTDQIAVFGPGIHHCIGHLLAKMQLTEFFPAFFSRFPDAALMDAAESYQPAFTFRGLTDLNLRLAPGA